MPSIYEPEIDQQSVLTFERRYGKSLITLPRELLIKLSPEGYADTNHFNRQGADQFQKFLAQSLIDHQASQ